MIFVLFAIFFCRMILLMVFVKRASNGDDKFIVLETTAASHYAEKVRWCMDHLGIPYEEEINVDIIFWLLSGRQVPCLLVPSKGICITNSSDILRYLYGIYAYDSARASFFRPTCRSIALEEKFDRLGEDLCRLGYRKLFQASNRQQLTESLWGINEDGIPEWQRSCLQMIRPFLQILVMALVNTSEAKAAESEVKARQVLSEVDDMLKDGRKFLLGTDRPTYLDFHFAAMCGVMLLPEKYGGPRISERSRIDFKSLPNEIKNQIEEFRSMPAGKFALRMYENYRASRSQFLEQ